LHAPNPARLGEFASQAEESLQAAEAMARAPQGDFDAFLASYLA
jgi:hypothetical protein